MKEPLRVFCCYARKDYLLFDKLRAHLEALEHIELINVQADIHIKPGDEWKQEIEKGIDTAQIILLLVSPNFMDSDSCYNVEMKRAIKQHELGTAKVIPLILRPTAWQDTPLGKFKALPSGPGGPKPIVTWKPPDEGFANIAQEIQKIAGELRREAPRAIPISPELLAVLNKHKEECQKLNIPFDTPHLFLALFDINHSRTLYHLNKLNPSYATKMREKYAEYTKKAQVIANRTFLDFKWEKQKDIQLAHKLALQDGSNEVTEAYLLLGVLDTKNTSITVEALKELLGENDFHALVRSIQESLRVFPRRGTLDSSRMDWSWDSSDTRESFTLKDIKLDFGDAEQARLAEEEQVSKFASGRYEGTLIAGRYEIREHIADGGMASVFKAWDHRVERIKAIKILHSLDKNNQRAVDRFRHEARAAATLAHPNAVTVFDFVEEMGQYFLVMEYIHGPTLKELIRQQRQLQPKEAIEIAAQVCSVLQVAHARDFIHRDIKPQNIMLAWRGGAGSLSEGGAWVKLTDFGIVRVAEDAGLTNSGIILGTADYLSPEQARGETSTGSSDLYSLGVVMFEMLAGRPPFIGPTTVSIVMQHASTNLPSLRQFNPMVPPALEQLVNRALQKEPEDRFPSASEMQKALRACAREVAFRRPSLMHQVDTDKSRSQTQFSPPRSQFTQDFFPNKEVQD